MESTSTDIPQKGLIAKETVNAMQCLSSSFLLLLVRHLLLLERHLFQVASCSHMKRLNVQNVDPKWLDGEFQNSICASA